MLILFINQCFTPKLHLSLVAYTLFTFFGLTMSVTFLLTLIFLQLNIWHAKENIDTTLTNSNLLKHSSHVSHFPRLSMLFWYSLMKADILHMKVSSVIPPEIKMPLTNPTAAILSLGENVLPYPVALIDIHVTLPIGWNEIEKAPI